MQHYEPVCGGALMWLMSHSWRRRRRGAGRGFTLIELAVALFVISLLLGSLFVPLTTQVEQRQVSDTQKTLEDIKEALLGFALNNGYLPCPDVTSGTGANDGVEDVAGGGACVAGSNEGNLPWVTLGVGQSDLWGNRFRYRVDSSFAQHPPGSAFTLASTAGIQLCAAVGCATPLTSSSPNGAVAVILSHGKNGYGAINVQSGAPNAAPTSADELENTNGNVTFVTRPPSPAGTPAGEFDDIVTWLSKYVLFNRMVTAGKLP